MRGLYDRTPSRHKLELDGWWSFPTDPQETCQDLADLEAQPMRRIWVLASSCFPGSF